MNTTIELVLSENTYLALKQAATQKKKSEKELAVIAIQEYLARLAHIDPLLGLFADEVPLIDEITEIALHHRENTPWRFNEVLNE